MKFWLSYENFTEKLLLPVNPGEFRISTGNKNSTIDIQNLGELNLIGGEMLASIQIASFFPRVWAPYCSTQDILEPYQYVERIVKWRKSRKPIRLVIEETPINLACTIESFEYGERGGSRDVEYTLVLKEYRFVQVSQVYVAMPVKVSSATQQNPKPNPKPSVKPSSRGKKQGTRPDPKPKPKYYTLLTPGEPLTNISRRVYGTDTQWRKIFEANREILVRRPPASPYERPNPSYIMTAPPDPRTNHLKPGTRLVIP